MSSITFTFLIALLTLLISYLFILWQRYQHFKQRDIPTPPFQFLYGHLNTLWSIEHYSRQLEKWTQTYGKIYGIFEGSVPIYVVSDLDFLQEIFIKQFSNFHGRKGLLVVQPRNRKEFNLLNSDGAQWRRQRNACSIPLSETKLKQMNSIFDQCVRQFRTSLATQETTFTEDFDIYPMYKRTCLNMMCAIFGIDIYAEKALVDEYAYYTEKLMSMGTSGSLLFKIADLFPFLSTTIVTYFWLHHMFTRFIYKTLLRDPKWEESPFFWLKSQIATAFKSKWNETDKSEQVDLLKLLKSKTTSSEIKDQDDIARANPQTQLLMHEEAVSNAFLFFTSGYLGPSATLAYATYVLANNHHVQQKLQNEIDQYFPDIDSVPQFDVISEMSYLDLFVREVLRMWPISISDFNRQCMKSTNVYQVHIPVGAFIQVDIYSINFNPDLWGPEDPYVFSPERHEIKRHPLAYLAFGAGPRNCIGTRLSLIEIKTVLIELLRHYTIVAGENLEKNMAVREQIAITPREIWIKLVKRK